MNIIPAVDIRCGEFVQFLPNQEIHETFRYFTPVEIAKHWKSKGADKLHITDYDGLFKGQPENLDIVREIKGNVDIEIQYSGGVSSIFSADRVFESGADEFIINVINVSDDSFVEKVCEKYNKRIILGIDIKDGNLVIEGWNNPIEIDFLKKIKILKRYGVEKVLLNIISRKETFREESLQRAIDIYDNTGMKVVLSGGISSLDDLKKIKGIASEKIESLIVGKALYLKKFSLKEANDVLNNCLLSK